MDQTITAKAGETLVDVVRRVYHLSPDVRPLRVASLVAQYTHANRLAVGNNVGHAFASEVNIVFPPWSEVLSRLEQKPTNAAVKDTRAGMSRAMAAPIKLAPDRDREAFVRSLARIAATNAALAQSDFGAALAKALTPKESGRLFDGGIAATGATLRAAQAWLTKTAVTADATEQFSSVMGLRFNTEATSECANRKTILGRGLASQQAFVGLTEGSGEAPSLAFASLSAERVLASLRQLLPELEPRALRTILQRVLAAWGIAEGEWGDSFLAGAEEETVPVDIFVAAFDAQGLDGPVARWLWQQANSLAKNEERAWDPIAAALADLTHDEALQPSACVIRLGTEIVRRLRGNNLFSEAQTRALLAGRNFLSIRGEIRELIDRQLAVQLTAPVARVAVLALFLATDGAGLALLKRDQIERRISKLSA